MFTAMSYAELSSVVPHAGGAYNFARIGFGRGTSFIAGWMEWFASSVAGSMYALTFAIYALGRDSMPPPLFSRISSRRKTPIGALSMTGLIIVVVAVLLPTLHVASGASIMFLFLFFMVNLSVIKIRYNMGDELVYGFVMPLLPVFPLISVVMQAVLAVWLVHMSLIAWIVALSWILTGVLIYLLYSKSHAKRGEHDIYVLEEKEAPRGEEYRIMVALANPDTAIPMVRSMYRLCGAKGAHVELLHMVPVPNQVPLADAHHYMMTGKVAMIEVMLYPAPLFSVSTTIRYCRSIARGIVSSVREKNIDMLIMGYRGGKKAHGFRLGSTVDPVIERAPCDMVIFKGIKDREYQRVLVPVAGGPNSVFALEVASMLADRDEGKVVAMTVDTGGRRLDLD